MLFSVRSFLSCVRFNFPSASSLRRLSKTPFLFNCSCSSFWLVYSSLIHFIITSSSNFCRDVGCAKLTRRLVMLSIISATHFRSSTISIARAGYGDDKFCSSSFTTSHPPFSPTPRQIPGCDPLRHILRHFPYHSRDQRRRNVVPTLRSKLANLQNTNLQQLRHTRRLANTIPHLSLHEFQTS